MAKKLKDITILTVSYFVIGLFNIFIGVSDKNNIFFLIVGLVCMILAFGLYKLWNWIRIAAIIISLFFVLIYVLLIIGTVMNKFGGWGGLGLLFDFPILALGLYALDVLMRASVKQEFLRK